MFYMLHFVCMLHFLFFYGYKLYVMNYFDDDWVLSGKSVNNAVLLYFLVIYLQSSLIRISLILNHLI